MEDAGQNRISVLRDNQLVPLVPCISGKHSEPQPWRGVLLERHTMAPTELPEHEHRELCLHLQLSGDDKMRWWSGGAEGVERTFPGSIMVVPAGTRDRAVWHGSSERLILSIRPEILNEIAASTGSTTPEFGAQWSLRDPALGGLMSEMGREAVEGWPLGSLYADLMATGLVSQLLYRHAVNSVDLRHLRGGLPVPQLRRAMEYISENLARDVRLEEVAGEVKLSPFHFAREFRAATGKTPYQYLLDQRMDKAKHLLKHHSWPVQEIAGMTGFQSAVNFGRTFRQRVGVTPGVWRRDSR
ncbi:helix-turn-helix transcriptional regulator [Edaphobacter sp. HDX4]|uniref:AraC family transcriptional regulator n=1 Tax=Edaphobacter sp. HDX4 TaxID=2794064 RepID=UPI002FE699E3